MGWAGTRISLETLEVPAAGWPDSSAAKQRRVLCGSSTLRLSSSVSLTTRLLAPTRIVVDFALTRLPEQDFALDVYSNGLGEFFARNNLVRFGKIEIATAYALAGPARQPAPARPVGPEA